MTDIYGIDPDDNVTPIDVRNALVECFTLAHGDELAHSLQIDLSNDTNNEIKQESIITFLKGVFESVGGDFDSPTKEELIRVVDYLIKFSANFREPEVIKKHAYEITILIDKLT